jgi:hypothetical protein
MVLLIVLSLDLLFEFDLDFLVLLLDFDLDPDLEFSLFEAFLLDPFDLKLALDEVMVAIFFELFLEMRGILRMSTVIVLNFGLNDCSV